MQRINSVDLHSLIQDYLAAPNERRETTLAAMIREPDAAFAALTGYRGPYPDHLPAVDIVPDFLSPLLTELLRACPRLLLERDLSALAAGVRWTVLAAASDADRPEFAPVILAGLNDRSLEVKELVVKCILRYPPLRRAQARRPLKRLRAQKSLAFCRAEIEQALASLDQPGN